MWPKIKVLFVIGQLSVGGTEIQLLHLAAGLDSDQFEPMVVCLSGTVPSLAGKFQEINIPTIVLQREKLGRMLVLRRLAEINRVFKPDIVHAFGYASRAAIPASRLFFNAKVIISIRTQPERHINWMDKKINVFADRVLTNSQKAARSIDSSLNKSIPVQVIYNGIDLDEFDSRTNNPVTQRDINGSKVICSVARMHPVKGLDILLDAFAILSKPMDHMQLWLVGDGPERNKLESQAVDLGIRSNVIFWGEQENIPPILRHASLGVLASRSEGLPNAVIEYMAARLPVVATDAGGTCEVVVNGRTGLLVPPENAADLAEALRLVLENEEKAFEMGKAGRKRVEELFTVGRMIAETEHLYKALIDGSLGKGN
jgi:L-malate glycosyltransferase